MAMWHSLLWWKPSCWELHCMINKDITDFRVSSILSLDCTDNSDDCEPISFSLWGSHVQKPLHGQCNSFWYGSKSQSRSFVKQLLALSRPCPSMIDQAQSPVKWQVFQTFKTAFKERKFGRVFSMNDCQSYLILNVVQAWAALKAFSQIGNPSDHDYFVMQLILVVAIEPSSHVEEELVDLAHTLLLNLATQISYGLRPTADSEGKAALTMTSDADKVSEGRLDSVYP